MWGRSTYVTIWDHFLGWCNILTSEASDVYVCFKYFTMIFAGTWAVLGSIIVQPLIYLFRRLF